MTTGTSRPIPLALTFVIALFAALAALAATNGHDAHAHDTAASPAATTPKELALHDSMRQLWEDHVTWTRLAVISLVGATPDADATVARLLRNQADIGDALVPFYGRAAADAVTAELRRHILIAADLIAAAKAGDADRVAAEQERWSSNADDIARLLESVNPRNWQRGPVRAMLEEHLRLTTDEVVARLQGDWEADVRAYDRIHEHALGMADALSDGIVAQFPKRFGESG